MPDDVENTRKFIKSRLLTDRATFNGYESERQRIRDILERTAEHGESNSALLLGPRGIGKTTLITSVLAELMAKESFYRNTLIVYLNGLIHIDDRLALKSATAQMNLENAVDGKVFGSFAENLAFLLECLKAGDRSKSKSVIFLLEEFDLFCSHHNQTLLYNLFDVAQSAQAPICVVGVTARLDVIELLEKRVKSRFSHRQVFLLPPEDDFEGRLELFADLLKLPTEREVREFTVNHPPIPREALSNTELTLLRNLFDPTRFQFSPKWVTQWNRHIDALVKNPQVQTVLRNMYDYDVLEGPFRLQLFELINELDEEHSTLTVESIQQLGENYESDDKVKLLVGLSVLEMCLVIAMKHHSEIYDRDPFNFEMILTRFGKWANSSSSMQGIERPVVLKAFEHLKQLELIAPVTGSGLSKVQKEYQLHRMLLTYGQIHQAVQRMQFLPTETVFPLGTSQIAMKLLLLLIGLICCAFGNESPGFFIKLSKSVPRIGRRGDLENFFLKQSKSVPRIGRRAGGFHMEASPTEESGASWFERYMKTSKRPTGGGPLVPDDMGKSYKKIRPLDLNHIIDILSDDLFFGSDLKFISWEVLDEALEEDPELLQKLGSLARDKEVQQLKKMLGEHGDELIQYVPIDRNELSAASSRAYMYRLDRSNNPNKERIEYQQ
uniref:Origin recognition complex subunit 4 n=1 Tax=Anopheles farauti TaxID=69004 RepID=A0A182Q574_9DIPT